MLFSSRLSYKLPSMALLLLCASVTVAEAHWWEDLLPSFSSAPNHKSSQLYLEDVGLNSLRGYVAAVGDFNSDKYTDLFIVYSNGDTQSMQVYLFYENEFSFKPLDGTSLSEVSILNVAPGDYDYDGNLDVIVTGIRSGELFMHLYVGDHKRLKFELDIVKESGVAPLDQVLVMDANNDQMPDLFGASADTGDRVFWMNNMDVTSGPRWIIADGPSDSSVTGSLSIPNSNAFVDINGDCISDLIIVSEDAASGLKSVEIWLNQKKSGFIFDGAYPLVPGAGQLSFADIDADGSIDIIYPVCYPSPTCAEENSIHILSNDQLDVCSGLWSTDCRSPSDLCSNTQYSLPPMNTTTNSENVVILDSFSAADDTLWADPSLAPLAVHIGDYNLDGYADILVPILTSNGDHTIQLWKNIACTKDLCSDDAVSADRRTFERVTDGTTALSTITTAYSATFFDIGELGINDILVLVDDGVESGVSSQGVKALYNNFFNDAYFVKLLGLNGICPGWCKGGHKFPDPKPYGVNFPGGVFKFTVTDAAGKKRGAAGVQLTQSAYLALQSPYVLIGLGRTSNYIDSMFYGITSDEEIHYNQWQGIIPNSQVAAFPYKVTRPSGWIMEMYISPSGILFWVIVMCVAFCILFALFIGYFAYRERAQDKLEQEKGFSFNPL